MSFSSINKTTLLLTGVLLILIGLITVLYLNLNHQATTTDGNQVSSEQARQELLALRESDHVYGDRDADTMVGMYSDATCNYCRWQFMELLNLVDATPAGEVAFVYRYLPIWNTRSEVSTSEVYAECVAEQIGDDGFFMYHETLFSSLPPRERLDTIDESFMKYAAENAGSDLDELRLCVANFNNQDRILSDHRSGGALNIVSVPQTFVVSDTEIVDFRRSYSEAVFRSAIDELKQ
jgi:protein-disulfide isomerase